jgi:hypothetical protein
MALGIEGLTGITSTGEPLPAEVKIDVSEELLLLQNDITPITTIMVQNIKKQPTNSFEFVWWEKDNFGYIYQSVTALLAASTQGASQAVTVSDSSAFKVNDIALIQGLEDVTNALVTEVVKVLSIDNATQITIERGFGNEGGGAGNSVPAIQSGANLYPFSSAFPQGGPAPVTFSVRPVRKYNFTQILRESFGVDNTLGSSKLNYDGSPMDIEDIEALLRLKLKMEYTVLYGRRNIVTDATTGKFTTATNGIINILYNDTDVYKLDLNGANITEAQTDYLVEKAFEYSDTPRKWFICSRPLARQLNQISALKIQSHSGEDTYGVRVNRWETNLGILDIWS